MGICLWLDKHHAFIGCFKGRERMTWAAIRKINGDNPGFDILLSRVLNQIHCEVQTNIFVGNIFVQIGVVIFYETH